MKLSKPNALFAAVALAFVASAASAAPVNLVQNGSFEDKFAGWTQSGTQAGGEPAVVISYNSNKPYPFGASTEPVAPANTMSLSPDAAGDRAAYFVDNHSTNYTLSQSIYLTAGHYRVGFDAYAPQRGMDNIVDASFRADIAGITLANYKVSTQPAVTWVNYSGLANVVTDGFYDISFVYNTSGAPAKDIVIDRVYAVATTEGGGTDIPPGNDVPEPSTLALLGLGLLALRAKRVQSKK